MAAEVDDELAPFQEHIKYIPVSRAVFPERQLSQLNSFLHNKQERKTS